MNTGKSRCNQALDLTGDERRVVFKNHNESSSKVMLFILKARDYMCALAVIIGIGTGASVEADNEEDVPNEEVPVSTQAPTTKAPSRFKAATAAVKGAAKKAASGTITAVKATTNAAVDATNMGKTLAQEVAKGTTKKVATTALAAVPGGGLVVLGTKLIPESAKNEAARVAETAAGKAGEVAVRKTAGAVKSMASRAGVTSTVGKTANTTTAAGKAKKAKKAT